MIESLKNIGNTQPAQTYVERLSQAPLVHALNENVVDWYWGEAHVYADDPEKVLTSVADRSTHMTPSLDPYFQRAERELIMFTPYFVPGDEGVEYLAKMAGKGVAVTVITNSLASTDVPIVHAGYSRYREDLLSQGVRLLEVKPGMIQEKEVGLVQARPASMQKPF